ncbi:fungal-specific transcription factor domain-domain-containing protein [Lobosporangium transversale]|uniref:Fungal-specific transcription factor domain-domain-containing protein n=1 Tax=Lobosporangium transversale TaxID=64571 RepID=A0A1Y2G6X2_9FUNG|nr:fungal-specific transcription factor domain-domain-containing protein [Lobosporangium transversale]ORY99516.1 fungal-specific transcription factor domain-domain-containing protein [Lobosporangium transversale]|eukprot:XP_021875842.1 fungal-specific transcription factor domain-domain-containing protein [Lobosporangium transversale]
MTESPDEAFSQNGEGAKRFKSGYTNGQSSVDGVNSNPHVAGRPELQQYPILQGGQTASSLSKTTVSEPITQSNTAIPEQMDALAAMLSETTLNTMAYYGPNAATISTDLDDDDLWGPQIRSTNTEDQVVPPEMRILPDVTTRKYLAELYYKNHFILLPMVQREVLRVCEENIHIPHCLLLCNAVYYCGCMYSDNTLPLRKDSDDESTVGEDFFVRGQALLDKKYLTTHICTIQSLLLFAIGHKSPAQRSGFISQAITMALDMGLHTKLDESVNPFMRAYRARVFWCCYVFDSTSSAIGGKPTLINDDEISVEMVQVGDLGPDTEYYSDQYLIHCVRGWQICRKIRKNSKLVSQRPPPSKQVLLENLDRLDKELVEWQEKLPPVFDLVPKKGSITSDGQSTLLQPPAVSNQLPNQLLPARSQVAVDPSSQQGQQTQAIFGSWMPINEPSIPGLNSVASNLVGDSNHLGGLPGTTTEEVIDIQSIAFDPRQEALFSTAASSTYNTHGVMQTRIPSSSASPSAVSKILTDDIFLTSIPRSQTSLPSPATSHSSASVQNPLSPPIIEDSTFSLQPSASLSPHLQKHSQSSQGGNDSINNHSGLAACSPDMAPSNASSPSNSLSEEAMIQSFTGQMVSDTFYMHINLPAEHPRNDPTSFLYLPSELEYGDTTALSPAASGGSSEIDTMSPPPF